MKKRISAITLPIASLLLAGLLFSGVFTAPLTAYGVSYDYGIPETWDYFCPEGHRDLFYFKDGEPAYVEGDRAEEVYDYRNSVIRQRTVNEADDYTVSATFTPEENLTTTVERSYGLTVWYLNSNNFLQYFLQQKTNGGYSAILYGLVEGQKRIYAASDSDAAWSDPATDPVNTGLEFADIWWDSGRFAGVLNGRKADNSGGDPDVQNKFMVLHETVTLRADVVNVRHTGLDARCKRFDLYVTCRTSETDDTPIEKLIGQFWVKGTAEGDTMAGIYFNRFSFYVEDFTFYSQTAIVNCEALIDAIPAQTDANFAEKAIAASVAYHALSETQSNVDAEKAAKLREAELLIPAAIDEMIEALDASSANFSAEVSSLRDTVNSLNAEIYSGITKISALEEAERTVALMKTAADAAEIIDMIPAEVTADARGAVEAARAAYDKLSEEAKKYVPADKLSVLTAAEAKLADIEAAMAVRNMILEIPSRVTSASKELVESVRAAYDALTDSQKALISEDELAALNSAEEQIAGEGGKGGCGGALGAQGAFGAAALLIVAAAVSAVRRRSAKGLRF